jgi:CHAT domain-containing protein
LRNFFASPWRWPFVITVLCSLAFACVKRETAAPPADTTVSTKEEHLRVVEPWLSGFGAWQACESLPADGATIPNVRCKVTNTPRRFVSIEIGSCDAMMRTHQDAVELLAYVPLCTDAAVAKLGELVAENPRAELFSDLAGAHLTRARRQDKPADYVEALAAAEKALKRNPRLPQARFNAALAQEGIGFTEDALDSWRSLAQDAPGRWKAEAEAHARGLETQRARKNAVQWRLNVGRLPEAMNDTDPGVLEALISPFRASAQTYVEEEVLRNWSLASATGRTREAAAHLAVAGAIAQVLEKLNHDRYLSDVVSRVQTCRDPQVLAALREGHVAFANARSVQRSLAGSPLSDYVRAEAALTRAGSPLRFGARLGVITALTVPQPGEALRLIEKTEREAERHSYKDILARAYGARGYMFSVKGNHFQSLAEYTKALAIYGANNDVENLGSVQSRRLGAFVEIGSIDETWRQVLLTRRLASDFNARHLELGETARLAVEMNHPEIGLRFQDLAVRYLQDEISQTKNEARIRSLRRHLGIAFRARATMRARLNDSEGALADVAEAARLIEAPSNPQDASIPIGFRARLAEAEAHAVGKTDPAAAIRLLSRAILDVQHTHYQSLRASLLLQRAELRRLDSDRIAALNDVNEAVQVLRKEAHDLFDASSTTRKRDQLWDAYLSRRQVAYRQLVRLLVNEHDDREAFNQAEESRAYEPLYALRRRKMLPSAFSALTENDAPLPLSVIEQVLPKNTYVLRYCVLDDETYVWIVGRGHSERMTLNIGNDKIARWSATLQRHAMTRADEQFRLALKEPYAGLLKRPLQSIGRPADDATLPRVIVVPDRAMHGLPFSALSDGQSYVMERHLVSVAASATHYVVSLLQNAEIANDGEKSVLLLGDPAFDDQQDLARGLQQSVPGLRIDRIADIYRPRIAVKPLTRKNATIRRFLTSASGSSVIHIAAHGVANADAPSRSFFLLAPAANDTGTLDAETLLRDLRLEKARLAVLGACSSAGGAAVGPDGFAPLVRPLVFAGVPGVVGTLWNISAQQETEELLVRFHRHYRAGHAADEALRLAQMSMLREAAAARNTPRAWGAFQMIGSASSPFPPSQQERRR